MVDKQVAFEDIEGKTVKRVFYDYGNEVLIVFTDGMFAVLYSYEIDGDTTIEDRNFRLWEWRRHADELLALGCVTQEQYDRHITETQHHAKQATAARRAAYESLKAEFERGA
jgi:hypothetical protein